jgi:hypothetical protein
MILNCALDGTTLLPDGMILALFYYGHSLCGKEQHEKGGTKIIACARTHVPLCWKKHLHVTTKYWSMLVVTNHCRLLFMVNEGVS